jgi:putative membrane protein
MQHLIPFFTIGFIAIIHVYIVWLEMFAWTSRGPKVFRQFPKELFQPTKALAGNQGLYNGFLAAGLIWSLLIENAEWKTNVAYFFLACVAIAGIYGAATASKKILLVQFIPALIGIVSVWICW